MNEVTFPIRYEPEHYEFEFYFLPKNQITHEEVANYCSWVSTNFASICTIGMTSELNSEWIFRTYSATKMVMAATLLLNSAKYCINKNVLSTVPYLLYYAAFCAARSLIYVAPFPGTTNLDKLVETTHSKVLKVVPDIVARLNKAMSVKIKDQLYELRSERELFSYDFPAKGLTRDLDFEGTVNLCGILVELAELTGRRVQHYIEKHYLSDELTRTTASTTWQVLNIDIITRLYSKEKLTAEDKITWIDEDDWYRVNYIKRKVKHPCSIRFTMTEGMTEDFFGAWWAEAVNEDAFNPDRDWNIIFPIP